MEYFIYYCENANSGKMNFSSRAILDTGMTVTNEEGTPFTIVDMIIQKPISVYEDVIERMVH